MKVGILGTGEVGRTLGAGFAGLGHEVRIGSREPGSDKLRAWAEKTGARASSGTFAEAASFAEVAVLATLWTGTESALRLAGPENLAGKVVIDATNPLLFDPAGRRSWPWATAIRVGSRCSVGCRTRASSRRSTPSAMRTW